MAVPTLLGLLLSSLLLRAADAGCPGERPTKHLVCYVDSIPEEFDPCLCTHLVINAPLDKLSSQHEAVQAARRLQGRNPDLRLVARLSQGAEALRRRGALAHTAAGVVHKLGLDGVEVDLQWGKEGAAKVQLVDFVQALSKELAQENSKDRSKRSYKIHEDILDDVVTPRWTPHANSRTNRRKTRDAEEKSTSTTEEAEVTTAKEKKDGKEDKKEKEEEEENHTASERSSQQEIEEEEEPQEGGKLIILHLTSQPQHLAKNFDLKRLSKYVSFYTLASDNLTDATENGHAYHPSRLMGIEDILNADSLIDLVTGLGAPHDKLVLTLPATALRFTLQDKEKNMAQSPVTGPPSKISRAELCKLMSQGEWTLERDEDLTAPYAFHDTTWVAFEDPTSVSIKAKYVILRDLGGAAVSGADSEDWSGKCNSSGAALLTTLHDTFTHVARKSRAAQLVDLQEQLHSAGQFSYSGDIHLSPYRIVRVVDRAGAIHVVRKEAKTEFECSRQGYFRHPSGCNRFYRCVKFNQYSPDFTVFEYDCPAGLAFDESVEVCVWPGSLADGGACQGSSEIAPVPRQRYVCPTTPGYYADPENCRWFFACLDHHGDGSPLTAYEFRCPFGLVFDEQSLVCNWPWLVPGCGGSGVYSARFTVGDFFEGRHRPSYASVSDYHVSGGRIENVPGGVVLGSALSGIGSGAYLGSYASGSNALGSGGAGYDGSSGADGLRLGVYSGGPGAGYVAGPAGSLASGSYQSNLVSGTGSGAAYSGSGAAYSGSGAAYSGSGAAYTGSGVGSKYASGVETGSYAAGGIGSSAYSGGAGYTGGVGGFGGSGSGYNTGSGAAYSGSGIGSKFASGIDTGTYTAGGVGSSAYSGGAGYTGGAGGFGGSGSGYNTGSGAAYSGSGIGSKFASGINTGTYTAGGVGSSAYSGGAGYTGGVGGSGSGYNAGSGAAYSGSGVGSKYAPGIDSGSYVASGGAGYFGVGGASGFGTASGYSADGGAYSGTGVDSGAYVAGGAGPSSVYRGSGAYSGAGKASAGYKGSGKYSASYSGAAGAFGNAYSGGARPSYSSTKYGGASAYSGIYGGGSYYDQSGSYVEDNSGSYIHDNSGDYLHDGAGDAGGLYSGKESYGGQYTGGYIAGGAYVPGVYDNGAYSGSYSSGGQYKGSYVGGGEYSGSYDTGAYRGEGSSGEKYKGEYDAGSYSGKYDAGSYAGKYDTSGYSGKYDAGSYSGKHDTSGYSGKYDGGAYSGKYEGGAYSGKYDGGAYSGKYDGGSYTGVSDSQDYRGGNEYSGGSTSYQGGYNVHSAPGAVVTSGESHEYNGLHIAEHQPAHGLVGLDAVKVTGGDHAGGYISSYVTPAPLPAVSVTPVSPVVSSYSTPTPAPIFVSTYKPSTVQPTTPRPVTYYPVPSSPVTPVTPNTLISYSTVKPPAYVASYEQPSYVRTVTPAPPVVSYSTPTIGVTKTPVVPLNPVTYSYKQPVVKNEYTPTEFQYRAPSPVGVSYEQPSYIKPVTPAPYYQQEFVEYGYKKPIPPAYLPPLPSYSYEYKPATYLSTGDVKYSYPKPAVLKTPIVPLNPIQYSTPSPIGYSVAPLKPISYATSSPVAYPSYPSPAPVSYTGHKYLPPVPVEQVKPITYSTPAPPVSFEYSAPAFKYTPTVLKTPVVPLNPVQYSTPAPVHFEYSTPSPVKTYSYSTPSPPVSYTPAPVRPLKPITYTTPAPPVSYEYSTPRPIQPVRPLRPISYSTPAPFVEYNVPTVLKTPVVPLNPIQYTTPAPVHFEYSTPAPPKPVTFVRPATYSSPAPAVSYGYSTPAPVQPLRPITYSTPAPAVNYEYSAPQVRPVVPLVAQTPVVPLNRIQYTTPVPQYEYKYSTPAPIAPVSYAKPLKPVAPAITYYSTPAPPPAKPAVTYYSTPSPPPARPVTYEYSHVPVQPVNFAKPLRPVTYSTPAPAISYEYSRPTVTPVVLKTPVVPLNPIQYTTPAPVHFQYSTPAPYPVKPVTYTVPAPQLNYEYVPQAPVKPLKPTYYSPPVPVEPLKPLRPITYTKPAPAVTYEYSYPVQKPVVPTVLKTPLVPLNPVQYTTPAPVYFEHSTPAPYKPAVYSTPAPAVYSTPAPAVYSKPAPAVYSRPAPAVSYEYVPPAPVRPLKPITYSTPAPAVTYEYLPPAPVQPVKQITLSSPAPFSYDFKYQPVKQVPVVLKTPVVPLNPIQYTTPAPAIYQYSTPTPTTSYVKPFKPVYSTPAPPTVSYEYSTPAPPPTVTYGYKSTAHVKPVPTVLKTPVVPLNPVQYSTPAPIVNQYQFGVNYETPEIQYGPDVTYKQQGYVGTKVVKEGYDYPKPAVRFEEAPKFVSTTPAPAVTYTYEAPETTPVYKQIYNYVKTPVVSAYDKVLSAISYSTTPAPLPVQPVTQSPVSYAPVNVGQSYSRPALVRTQSIPLTPVTVVPEYQKVLNVVKASTTPSPLYVNHYTSTYEPELFPVSTPKPVVYRKKPTVVTEGSYVKDYSYEENIDEIYDAVRSDFGSRLAGGYEGGYVYNQQRVEVPEIKVYTSTTPAPVPVIKETYRVRKPIKTVVSTYEQPSIAVGYEAGSYEGGSTYSTTGAPAVVSSSEAVFGEQYHKETSFSGYTGVEGDSFKYEELDQAIPAVPVYTSTIKPPTVKVTTARVSLPVVTSARPEGAYYVRKQKVRVRPVVTENYPDVYSSTYTPVSTTTFAPTYSYSTTPAVVTSSTVNPDDVVDVEGEEEDGVKILEGFDGQYGGVVNKGYVSSTVASIEDGEAVVGILKKGKITYDGRRTKTKVVVVSKLSDFNPLLVGKLGAECSCDGRSNTVTVRRNKQRGSNKLFTPSRDSTIPDQQYVDTYQTSTTTGAPIVVKSEASYESSAFESSSYNSPVVEIKPIRKKTRFYSTTTSAPEYQEEEIVSEANYVSAGENRVKDRIECKRAGLFRHPKKCNKFYSCDWDQWKKKFTVNEFKCPIHLAYDANLGACNWPSKGPACAEDNLLV